jgi:hypothetical protein
MDGVGQNRAAQGNLYAVQKAPSNEDIPRQIQVNCRKKDLCPARDGEST